MKNLKKWIFTILFTLLAVGINFCGSKLALAITFPLYLDSVLTISVVALCGLIPGIVCAVLSNFLTFITENTKFLFVICHIFTAIGAYFVFKNKKAFQDDDDNELFIDKSETLSLELFLWAGLFSAITNTIFGNILSSLILSNGIQKINEIQGIFIKLIYASIPNLTFANWLAGFLENIMDKLLSALISFAVYKVCIRIFPQIKNGFAHA